MAELRVLVVDDEPVVRRDLVRHLSREPQVTVVAEARNGIEALEQIDALAPDAVFLDVQMPELDGLGVVSALDPDRRPAVVFVTAFDRYALQAFDLEAVDYLLKPFDAERCRRAVQRVRQRIAQGGDVVTERMVSALVHGAELPRFLSRLAVRAHRRIVVIAVENIRWIEAADNYARLHLLDGSHLTRRTMRDLAASLDPAVFARVHRSAIVNLAHVRELRPLGDGDYRLTLAGGAIVTLSRTYRDAFEARYGGIA